MVVVVVAVIVMHNQRHLSTFDLKQTAGFTPRVESVLPDFVTGFCQSDVYIRAVFFLFIIFFNGPLCFRRTAT